MGPPGRVIRRSTEIREQPSSNAACSISGGMGVDEGLEDPHRDRCHPRRLGQHDGGPPVQKVQPAEEDEEGHDQDRAGQHLGEEEDELDPPSPPKAETGEGIGRPHRQRDGQQGDARGDRDHVPEPAHHRLGCEEPAEHPDLGELRQEP